MIDAGLGAALGGLEAQRALDLATGQAASQAVAEAGLEIAQGLGQAEVRVEIALVDRPQFQLQPAPVGVAILP